MLQKKLKKILEILHILNIYYFTLAIKPKSGTKEIKNAVA